MSLINLLNFYHSNSEKNFRKRIIQESLLFVTSKSTYAIDHVNRNFVFTSNCKSVIIKTNLLYEFAILMSCGQSKKFLNYKIYKINLLFIRKYSQKNNLNDSICTKIIQKKGFMR